MGKGILGIWSEAEGRQLHVWDDSHVLVAPENEDTIEQGLRIISRQFNVEWGDGFMHYEDVVEIAAHATEELALRLLPDQWDGAICSMLHRCADPERQFVLIRMKRGAEGWYIKSMEALPLNKGVGYMHIGYTHDQFACMLHGMAQQESWRIAMEPLTNRELGDNHD